MKSQQVEILTTEEAANTPLGSDADECTETQ